FADAGPFGDQLDDFRVPAGDRRAVGNRFARFEDAARRQLRGQSASVDGDDERRIDARPAPERGAGDENEQRCCAGYPKQPRRTQSTQSYLLLCVLCALCGFRVAVHRTSLRGSRMPRIARRLSLATAESASVAIRRLSALSRLLSAVTTSRLFD